MDLWCWTTSMITHPTNSQNRLVTQREMHGEEWVFNDDSSKVMRRWLSKRPRRIIGYHWVIGESTTNDAGFGEHQVVWSIGEDGIIWHSTTQNWKKFIKFNHLDIQQLRISLDQWSRSHIHEPVDESAITGLMRPSSCGHVSYSEVLCLAGCHVGSPNPNCVARNRQLFASKFPVLAGEAVVNVG